MAVLLPVVLLAGGRWRALTAAAVTVLALASASVIAFGLEPWGGVPGEPARRPPRPGRR